MSPLGWSSNLNLNVIFTFTKRVKVCVYEQFASNILSSSSILLGVQLVKTEATDVLNILTTYYSYDVYMMIICIVSSTFIIARRGEGRARVCRD